MNLPKQLLPFLSLLLGMLCWAQKPPFVNALDQSKGRLTGVQIVQDRSRMDAPPKVIVRGYNTWNNNAPLYVIDGVQTEDPMLFNSINPYDIESVTALKGPSASVYGARGANGVIIVKTKEAACASKKNRKKKKKRKKGSQKAKQ